VDQGGQILEQIYGGAAGTRNVWLVKLNMDPFSWSGAGGALPMCCQDLKYGSEGLYVVNESTCVLKYGCIRWRCSNCILTTLASLIKL
jgi:hypothetical protein